MCGTVLMCIRVDECQAALNVCIVTFRAKLWKFNRLIEDKPNAGSKCLIFQRRVGAMHGVHNLTQAIDIQLFTSIGRATPYTSLLGAATIQYRYFIHSTNTWCQNCQGGCFTGISFLISLGLASSFWCVVAAAQIVDPSEDIGFQGMGSADPEGFSLVAKTFLM